MSQLGGELRKVAHGPRLFAQTFRRNRLCTKTIRHRGFYALELREFFQKNLKSILKNVFSNKKLTSFSLYFFNEKNCFHYMFAAGMWKRKRQIFMETEAGSGKRVLLQLWPFIANVKNSNMVQFL